MASDKDIIIKVDHLTKCFGDKTVLDDISLKIRRGEFITLLGPSGCGKTTMLRLLAGFNTITSGRIFMEGKDISDVPPYLRPLNTVFQRYALFPHLDVYDNVAFGLKLNKVPVDEIDRRVSRVLKMVSMNDYEDRDVDSLSGGQQQRVAIARAIINQPKVLLLDEPLSALDLKMRKDMQIELKQMHKTLGITFIYVTHDQEEALTLSDTVVVMNEGHILQIGTPKDIYNEPVNSFVADFIGESNILNGVMLRDRRVSFISHEFDCVDEGMGDNVEVDVVVRPEDIAIVPESEDAQFCGTVSSCTFKGVHYEMFVNTDDGFELMIQNYSAFEPGTRVGMSVCPDGIHVMRKERVRNTVTAEVVSDGAISMFGGEFECRTDGFSQGDAVEASVEFSAVELLDNPEAGELGGQVHFILYKGDHYHITVLLDDGGFLYVDTDDIWDNGDMVGVHIAPEDIHLQKASGRGDE